MINFFRRIRQKLITNRNQKKYLAYAIGEILLVMIGILLALQVNNWNADRKRDIVEIEFLNGFKSNLENDLASIEKILPAIDNFKSSTEFIMDYMERDLPWNDSLKYHFGNTDDYWPASFTLSSYESISSRDWSIISNEKLRTDLINYYRFLLGFVIVQQNRYTDELFEISRNIWSTRFHGFWESNYEEWKQENNFDNWESWRPEELIGYKVPLNFEQLKSDSQYRYSLSHLLEISNWNRELALINVRRKAENLLLAIELELKEL